MELNFNNDADEVYLAFGITEERAKDISNEMEKILDSYPGDDSLIAVTDIIQKIAKYCNTVEELVFITLTWSANDTFDRTTMIHLIERQLKLLNS